MTTIILQITDHIASEAYDRENLSDFNEGPNLHLFMFSHTSSSPNRTGVGIRFTGAGVLKGATIDSATLEIRGLAVNSRMYYDTYGHDTDIAPIFSTSNRVYDRTQTTATNRTVGSYYTNDWNIDNQDKSAIVQEIIDRPGFTNTFVLLLISNNTVTKESYAYGASWTGLGPKITIDYQGGRSLSYSRTLSKPSLGISGINTAKSIPSMGTRKK